MRGKNRLEKKAIDESEELDPHARHPVIVSTALVVLALATVLALPRVSGSWETNLFRSINELPEVFYWPLWLVMQFGNMVVAPIAGAIAATLRRPRLGLELAIAGFVAWLVAKLIKAWVGRGRPGALLEDVSLREAADLDNGYVSGHTAVAFAMAVVLMPVLSKRWRVVVIVAAALVGVARMYVGVHLPLDVVGGAALGIAVGGVTSLALKP